jgi:acyl carrier protein
MEIRGQITEFICSDLLDGEETVEPDENLLADGMIDSLGMLRLVAFIEDSFDVKVPPEDFTIENFRTIELLDAYLTRVINGSAS